MKNFNVKDVCYNEECEHNNKCICYLKGVRPSCCIHAIDKSSLDLHIDNLNAKLKDKHDVIQIKDKLIAQLEDQNGRLIKERDDALVKNGKAYVYCTQNHGKFKSADKLYESYLNLEKEYTRSRKELTDKELEVAKWKANFEVAKEDLFKLKQELAKKEKQLNQYPHKNEAIEKPYEELKCAIDYLSTIEDKARFTYLSSLNHSIDVLCDKHKARIRDIEGSICTIEKLEKQNNEYADSLTKVLSENESLATRYTKLEEANKQLMELKAKEMGEALSDAFNNFTVAIRNKLDKETILKYVRTHNQDKIKLLEDIKESLEDITNYLLKKGDITWAGNDKILDYIDCKIEQEKGKEMKNE